ncbi:retrovirus-related pol polyprotein from transposon TNT 1-94, partial [Tanacetum coccineum]
MVGGNGRNQFRQYVGQNVKNQNGYNAVQNVRNQNGNVVAARAKGNEGNVSNIANPMKHMPRVKKPKKVGFSERLASPKPSKPRMCLRWSATRKMFDIKGKLIRSSDSECYPYINFLGTVRFGYDHVAAILGFDDLQWGNILISRVYFVEGLGHNLFSVGQFCDSDLEVAFRRNICFVRNLEGVDLLKGNRTTNLYTINLHDMASASPICLMARATSTKSWLWHQRLSHLNFDTINDLARNDLVTGLPKFKYHKEHLCPSCEQRKSKRASHPPKPVLNSKQRLHLLHMDLCGPMRIASINGKRYILVIVDDYSRTDNGTEFKNQVLQEYFNSVGISHPAYSVRTPQQNRVVERRNRTLVEAARTMLIFSRAPLFLWAEAIATAKLDISFLHVFGALCYPKNDREDIRKLGAKEQFKTRASKHDFWTNQFRTRSSLCSINNNTQKLTEGELDLLFEAMYDDQVGGQPSAAPRTFLAAQAPQVLQNPTETTTTADT